MKARKTKLTKPFCSGQGLKKSIDKGGNLLVTKNNLTHEVSADVKTIPEKPQSFMKRIGSNYYVVSVHFSDTNKENINDKIQRLIRNEIINAKAVGQ